MADENKGAEIGEKALYGAFTAAREKRDLQRASASWASSSSHEYPKCQYLVGRAAHAGPPRGGGRPLRARRPATSSRWARSWARTSPALDGWLAAARLRMALGDYNGRGRATLETAAELAGARKAEVLVLLAQAHLKMQGLAQARAAAEQALKLDKTNAGGGARSSPRCRRPPRPRRPAGGADRHPHHGGRQGPNGQTEEAAKALWYLGEILYRSYKALPADKVEEKVAALQQLEGIYTQAASHGLAGVGGGLAVEAGRSRTGTSRTWWRRTPAAGGPLRRRRRSSSAQAVKEQVAPLKQRADEAFKACLSRAESARGLQRRGGGLPHADRTTAALPVPQPGAPAPSRPRWRSCARRRRHAAARGGARGAGPGLPGRAAASGMAQLDVGPGDGAGGHAAPRRTARWAGALLAG